MSKPTKTPTWATDTNYGAGSEAWSATPTRVEPSTSEKASGAVPDTREPAQFANWLWGFLCDWIGWLDARTDANGVKLYPSGDRPTRTIKAPFIAARPDFTAGAPEWNNDTKQWVSAVNSAKLYLALDHYLPLKGNLNSIQVIVKPGAARTSTAKMKIELYKIDTTDDSTPTLVGTSHYDNGTTNVQALIWDDVFTFARSDAEFALFALVTAGNTAGTGGQEDSVFGWQIAVQAHEGNL